MKRPETIIVQFVHDYIRYDEKKKRHMLQFAGVSDKPTKLMHLQVWDMPFNSAQEARETLDSYLEKIKKGSFLIFLMPKK